MLHLEIVSFVIYIYICISRELIKSHFKWCNTFDIWFYFQKHYTHTLFLSLLLIYLNSSIGFSMEIESQCFALHSHFYYPKTESKGKTKWITLLWKINYFCSKTTLRRTFFCVCNNNQRVKKGGKRKQIISY